MDIIEKAVELGNMLTESKLFQNYKDAEEAYASDEQAQTLTAAYNAKRLEYAKKIHAENLSKEDAQPYIDELGQEFEALEKNESVKNYIEAKKKFDELYKNTMSVIDYAISGNEGSCDNGKCETCGGCH